MQKFYCYLITFVLIPVITGCAPKAFAPPELAKALENPTATNLPDKLTATEMAIAEFVPHDPPASCPITVPQDPHFVPPAPYNAMGFQGEFWYGSDSLWTAIRKNGIWEALPHNTEGYTQKVFWWRDGYVWNEEPEPELTVTGERLDAPVPALQASKATNASASDIGSAMLVGVDMPTLGCWKVTGKYGRAELSFVVWVAP
jgi:hypothetical protein